MAPNVAAPREVIDPGQCAIVTNVSGAAHAIPYPRITRDSQIAGGQPIVAGTRVPVATLVRAHQLGLEFDELLLQYPSVSAADLHAALLYYLDHSDEIEEPLREAEEPPEDALFWLAVSG